MKSRLNVLVDVTRAGGNWPSRLPPIKKVVARTLELAKYRPPHQNVRPEISIVLANDRFVRKLNKTYRHKDKPTNVLSFPQEFDDAFDYDFDQPSGSLGDVVLAYETIRNEATDQGKTFSNHLMHLIIHGILHLIGHDHETEVETRRMEKLEIRILAEFGVNNPYEI